MWWRVLSVVAAFGLVTTLAWPGALPSPTITELSQRPVAIATMPCERSLQAMSSGFVVDDETVITVAHAIFESRHFAVRDAAGRWHDADVRHMDLERDLAVLTVRTLPALPASLRVAGGGDPVRMLAGAASGSLDGEVLRRVQISTEVIGNLDVTAKRSGYELSVPIKGGDSGAGVVDDDGQLVGLMFARSTRREASWATSASEIQTILDDTGSSPTWECDRPSDAELILEPLEATNQLAPR